MADMSLNIDVTIPEDADDQLLREIVSILEVSDLAFAAAASSWERRRNDQQEGADDEQH